MREHSNVNPGMVLALLIMLLCAGCAGGTRQPETAAAAPPARITVLYDAFGKNPAMQKDWGYAALIEYGGKRILFDTGDNAEILAKNAKVKGVDLSRLDFVVMSHRHGDHMAGLAHVLSVNPRVRIYAPKENFGVYGFSLPSAFYRKDPSLPAEERYYDGRPPQVMKFGAAWPTANFELIDQTTEIAPGLYLIFQISDKPTTLELRELSLAIETPEGIVLVVGCSHPGLDKIVAAAAAIDRHIRLVTGGFHLVVARDAEIEQIVGLLHDGFRVDYVAPSHCTGEPTFTALRKAFGSHYLYAGLGTTLGLGATPLSLAGKVAEPQAMDEDDLRSYRALSAKSDKVQLLARSGAR